MALSFLPRRDRKIGLYVCAAILIAFYSLRSFDVGSDTRPYVDFFLGKKTSYYTTSDLSDYKFLASINTILRPVLFNNGTLYLILISSLFIVPYTLLTRKYSRNGTLAFVFFFVFSCYLPYMVAIRQVFSLGFTYWATFLFLNKVKWYKIICPIFIIIGALLHFSSIPIILIICISYFIRINNKTAALLLLTSSVVSYFISDIGEFMSFLFSFSSETALLNKIEAYSTHLSEQKSSFLYFIRKAILPTVLVYCFSKKEERSVFYNCFVFGEVIFLIGLRFPMIVRTVFGLLTLGTISMSNAFKLSPRKIMDYVPWGVIVCYLYAFIDSIINWDYKGDLSNILPYTFIFE